MKTASSFPTSFTSLNSLFLDRLNEPPSLSIPATSIARSHVLELGNSIGNLCHTIQMAPLDTIHDEKRHVGQTTFWGKVSMERDEIYKAVGRVFLSLVVLSNICCIDLRIGILKKMELNNKKYPVELCKGKSGKYTKYSSQTGITKDNQTTLDIDIQENDNDAQQQYQLVKDETSLPSAQTVPGITLLIREFAIARTWTKYHKPRNLTLAMMGEVGELAELFQWQCDVNDANMNEEVVSAAEESEKKDDDDDDDNVATLGDEKFQGLRGDGWKDEDIDHVQQELADVAIYCLRLADVVGIHDLGFVTSNL